MREDITLESYSTFFAQHNLKITGARSAILHVLKEARAPMSYEQIKAQMQHAMDKATFYRNVAKFEELGVLHKFEADNRKWYFELSTSTHAHFICEACHQITCIDVDLGYVDAEVKSIVLKGTCKECKT